MIGCPERYLYRGALSSAGRTNGGRLVFLASATTGMIRSVQGGGDPVGVAPTYYQLRAVDDVLPTETDWHAAMMDVTYPTE